jgi:hypothetical protein
LLVLVLLLLIPPHGILTANEENYFALAARFVDGSAWPQTTAVFDASRHRMLSDATLGLLVSMSGYPAAQIVTRLLVVVGFALTLPPLFEVFALSALDAALAVMSMWLIGQDIIGGEWLFSGYEAKVVAYVLVLVALRLVLLGRWPGIATLLFALATYFHFLVGGFWFVAALVLQMLDRPREWRRLATTFALYALLVAPLSGAIAWMRLTDNSAALATDVPTPDVIYSIIREPHHQSPFMSWAYFRDNWLPGYATAAPMLLAAIWCARSGRERRLRITAAWLAGLLAYLFFVLLPKYLDRDTGVLGKLYLFRPSSLIELLWLMLALAFALQLAGRHARTLRTVLLAALAPGFCYFQARHVAHEVIVAGSSETWKSAVASAVMRQTAPGDVVLVDPDHEWQWLDFERRTERPIWVTWKFAPTNDAELITWYRRIEQRRKVFEHGCEAAAGIPPPVFLLTTPATAARLAATCGPIVSDVDGWVLLRAEQAGAPATPPPH